MIIDNCEKDNCEKEVKVLLLLGICVKFYVKYYVRVIKIILFYKMKESACKNKGRVDSESDVRVGDVCVGSNSWGAKC